MVLLSLESVRLSRGCCGITTGGGGDGGSSADNNTMITPTRMRIISKMITRNQINSWSKCKSCPASFYQFAGLIAALDPLHHDMVPIHE